MAQSIQEVVSDGTLTILSISIDYLDRSEIAVVYSDPQISSVWSWVGTSDKKISFTPAVPNGVTVSVVRTTDVQNVRHEFLRGAAFSEKTMDENFTQILHIAQEAVENTAGIKEFFNDVNMHSNFVHNVKDGVLPNDAVTYSQLQKATGGDSAAAALVSANAAASSAAQANISALASKDSAASSQGASASAQGFAGLASNYALLSNISDYGLITEDVTVSIDYGVLV